MDTKQTTKLLGWSKKYLGSFQGILNICEIVICYASIRLLWDTCRPAYSLSVGGFVGSAQETYFYISSWACLIISCILLLSFTISHVSYMLLERTIIFFSDCVEQLLKGVMFWLTACLLSLITGLLLFVFVTAPKSVEVFGYSHKLGASILGLINSSLYAISAAKSYRACKNSWSYQLSTTFYLGFGVVYFVAMCTAAPEEERTIFFQNGCQGMNLCTSASCDLPLKYKHSTS